LEESQKGINKNKQVKVVLLTQDLKNREQAFTEGIPTYKGKQGNSKTLSVKTNLMISYSSG